MSTNCDGICCCGNTTGWRGTVRVKCLAQKHNIMSPARARNRTACSGVELTNHEATVPPTLRSKRSSKIIKIYAN